LYGTVDYQWLDSRYGNLLNLRFTFAVNDIESVLIQIRAGIVSGNARLDLNTDREYSESEALAAFQR
jgi:hypothetical protein